MTDTYTIRIALKLFIVLPDADFREAWDGLLMHQMTTVMSRQLGDRGGKRTLLLSYWLKKLKKLTGFRFPKRH